VKLFWITFFVFVISCSNVYNVDINLTDKIIIPKTYVVNRSENIIVIDGNDDEWKNAIYSQDFIDIEGFKIPSQKTNIKMLWDDNNLYVFAKLFEKHIWADIKKRDEVIYLNNDFEVFINPNDNVFNYGEIEINALGTEWDLFLDKPYRLGGKADSSWDIKGLKSAVSINGTLNNPEDEDKYWTVEMAIPIDQISQLKYPLKFDKIKKGIVWRINFSRVNWDFDLIDNKYFRKKIDGKFLPEYNWVWSNQGEINMHIPENWGYLLFNDSYLNSKLSSKTDLELEHTLYAIFREIKFGDYDYIKELKEGSIVKFKPEKINGKIILSYFKKTDKGFNINSKYKDGILNYSIDQTGLINRGIL
tara:strand:- start:3566 stop:4645 length:1080 start_codon:yes stop_codon:yes gene_type:complete